MKIHSFEFAPGARFQVGAERDAAAVGAHLEMLRKKSKGELTPEAVVDDARHDNSPLHSFFEWNDGIAAEQHRLHQARGLIRSVVAIYKGKQNSEVRQKAYVHIPNVDAPHYREISHALSVADTRQLVLQRALSELKAWKGRYKDLQEFAGVVKIIDLIDKDFPASVEEVV